MDISTNFDFTHTSEGNFSGEEGKEVDWKCILVETSISELASIFYGDATVIDYDRRGPGDYRQFTRHLENMLVTSAESRIIKSIGENAFLALKANESGRYQDTLESAKRMAKNDALNIVLMTRESFDSFFDTGKAYSRMAVPYTPESGQNIRSLVEKNWGKSIKAENKGFVLFDVFMDGIASHIDTTYLQSGF